MAVRSVIDHKELVRLKSCVQIMPGGAVCGAPTMRQMQHGWLCWFHDALVMNRQPNWTLASQENK